MEFKTMEEAKKYQKTNGGVLSHKRCCAMHLEGALRNFKGRSMQGLIVEENGAEWTDKMVRNKFKDLIAKGDKLISFGCDNFDTQTGCMGHDIKVTPSDEKS